MGLCMLVNHGPTMENSHTLLVNSETTRILWLCRLENRGVFLDGAMERKKSSFFPFSMVEKNRSRVNTTASTTASILLVHKLGDMYYSRTITSMNSGFRIECRIR